MEPSYQKKPMSENVHLLLLGRSQDHVRRVVEYYHPTHISFFTSDSLMDEAWELVSQLQDQRISTRIISVQPFEPDAIFSIMNCIIQEYENLREAYSSPDITFYIGLTGGTNLMVLGAGFAAFQLGIQSHYVQNPEFLEDKDTELINDFNLSLLMNRE